jgi:hypothetical protein
MARGKRLEKPAVCHPTREAHAEDLCAVCWFDTQRLLAAERVPKTALELRQKHALITLHQEVERVVELGRIAKATLRENLPRYAELHLTAAEVAAANGDARPAEWALQAVKGEKGERVVDPPKAENTGGGGIKILIGVNMGGLPAATVETVNASEE